MFIAVLKAFSALVTDSKTYKLLLLFIAGFTANARYTDEAKEHVLREIKEETRRREAWEKARENYGNLFLKHNDEQWKQQYIWNNRALDEMKDIHKGVDELLRRN